MRKVYVVGLGPGDSRCLTAEARSALDEAHVLCGYGVYVDLVAPLYPEKEVFTTPMTQELERCRWALESARSGRTTALVCSGDAGVYGMAGPLLELARDYPEVEVAVVPGITAALSGAAVLGAPLGHDFCVVSLSDLLTPWETISRRLECAAAGDFALDQNELELIEHSVKEMEDECGMDRNAALADMRYTFIETICSGLSLIHI